MCQSFSEETLTLSCLIWMANSSVLTLSGRLKLVQPTPRPTGYKLENQNQCRLSEVFRAVGAGSLAELGWMESPQTSQFHYSVEI